MKWHSEIIIASIISFLVGLSISISTQGNKNNHTSKPLVELNEPLETEEIIIETETEIEIPEIQEKQLTKDEIESLAKSITVKVLSGENSGSGILIKRQNDLYTVVTNHHVLIFGQEDDNYQIITPDGQNYKAEIIKNIDFHNHDLGLLAFRSPQNYPIIELKVSAKARLESQVYAAGFPYNNDKNNFQSISEQFVFTEGHINMISELSFRGGYQIGYTNDIKKGMSGGPLFNSKGKIIAINGRHKYPLWGNPYVFEDGSIANPETKAEMSQLSWGIPIQTFLKFSSQLAQKVP